MPSTLPAVVYMMVLSSCLITSVMSVYVQNGNIYFILGFAKKFHHITCPKLVKFLDFRKALNVATLQNFSDFSDIGDSTMIVSSIMNKGDCSSTL